MDQAAPAHQSLLRHIRKRRAITNLDRCLCLCSHRHRQKALAIKASLYTMLQVLSLTPFEKMPMDKAFFDDDYSEQLATKFNQLNLFD